MIRAVWLTMSMLCLGSLYLSFSSATPNTVSWEDKTPSVRSGSSGYYGGGGYYGGK